MKAAIEILKMYLFKAGALQASDDATSYCNALRLAISVLEKYDKKLDEIVQRELQTDLENLKK